MVRFFVVSSLSKNAEDNLASILPCWTFERKLRMILCIIGKLLFDQHHDRSIDKNVMDKVYGMLQSIFMQIAVKPNCAYRTRPDYEKAKLVVLWSIWELTQFLLGKCKPGYEYVPIDKMDQYPSQQFHIVGRYVRYLSRFLMGGETADKVPETVRFACYYNVESAVFTTKMVLMLEIPFRKCIQD